MTVFVQRNAAGEICGIFANMQHGFAEEERPADDGEVLSFLAAQKQKLGIG